MNIPQGPWYIDDTLTFTVITHDFATGALTDADSVPAYRVYEDETGTAILTGNMAKLDDANTTGFYSEQITLSAANGFEVGKSYSIYASAAVDSVTGGTAGGFKVIAATYPANVTQFGGSNGTFSGGRPEVNTTHAAGTAWGSGAITAASIATDAIDADALAADAIAEINATVDTALADIHLDHLLAATYDPASKPGAADALLNELVENDGGVSRFTANALEQAPSGGASAADIADAVWEEAIADHSGTAGSTAEQLAAAGAAGDPWATALPGAYGSGTAGKIVGDNLNATVSSRASQTSVDDLPTNSELATALASADDAVLAAIGDLPTAVENADALLDRDMSAGDDNGSATVRTPRQALRFLRNKWSISGTTLTVTKENDTDTSWTSEVTATNGADPITASDPASS